jgi:hypothetical protein
MATLSGLLQNSLGIGGSFGNTPNAYSSAQSKFVAPTPTKNATVTSGPGGAYPIAGGAHPAAIGGGGGGGAPVNTVQQQQQAPQDPYASIKSDISNAWDSYLSSLGGVGDYLNQQQTAQQGVADSQLHQGQDTINTQKASSLRDIANTTRNAFQAGNNYLGSLGAGDSSAANQYSFAINQTAGKQTGDLNNFVNSKLQELQSTHDQQVNSIANWFSQQQAALKQQIAQGGLNKGQDLANLSKGILDQAMQATNQLKANTQNQYNGLLSWAASNAQNVGQLQQNIAAIPQAMGAIQTSQAPQSSPLYGGAGPTAHKTDMFGNPI